MSNSYFNNKKKLYNKYSAIPGIKMMRKALINITIIWFFANVNALQISKRHFSTHKDFIRLWNKTQIQWKPSTHISDTLRKKKFNVSKKTTPQPAIKALGLDILGRDTFEDRRHCC